jgi:hypothetical protein
MNSKLLALVKLSTSCPPYDPSRRLITILGNRFWSESVIDNRLLRQNGQPPPPCFVRFLIGACQTWCGPSGHFHQTSTFEPYVKSSGEKGPFLLLCHWPAIWGCVNESGSAPAVVLVRNWSSAWVPTTLTARLRDALTAAPWDFDAISCARRWR